MSASGDIVRRLLARGLTGQQIGQAIGRDRSLVSQVGRGRKPGANLEAALSELERRADAGGPLGGVAEPARRTTRSGRVARVRRPTRVGSDRWSSTTIKSQAAASGGRALGRALTDAAEDGAEVVVTIVYAKSVVVLQGGSGKKGRPGPGGTVEMKVDADEFDGTASPLDWLNSMAEAAGYIPSGVRSNQVRTVELRTF